MFIGTHNAVRTSQTVDETSVDFVLGKSSLILIKKVKD